LRVKEDEMSGQTNETQWYIARDGKQHGPLTDIEMRTFVAHNYLRASDLIWRPGLPEWQAAPAVFPDVFQPKVSPQVAAATAAAARAATQPSGAAVAQAQSTEFDQQAVPAPSSGLGKRLAIAASAIAVLGGGAFALATYREPLSEIITGRSASDTPTVTAEAPAVEAPTVTLPTPVPESSTSPSSADSPDASTVEVAPAAQGDTATADTSASSAPMPAPSGLGGPSDGATTTDASSSPTATAPGGETAVAALDAPAPSQAPSVTGSATDSRLQKIPVWALIKKEYPDWYEGHVTTADKLAAENKPESEIALHLAQGLVALRRQHAEQALAASPDKLQKVAIAFLDNLKLLRAQSVSACYGFISKGETSPAVVQMLERPETASGLNTQAGAIFEAAVEGARTPIKHEAAIKSDYDILIKELSKLGWKDEDLQVFSNPKLLAKREPDQVCKMVQEWFMAHLAVANKTVRQRLLYETLKPVVSG